MTIYFTRLYIDINQLFFIKYNLFATNKCLHKASILTKIIEEFSI
jgi:hypothetical protein